MSGDNQNLHSWVSVVHLIQVQIVSSHDSVQVDKYWDCRHSVTETERKAMAEIPDIETEAEMANDPNTMKELGHCHVHFHCYILLLLELALDFLETMDFDLELHLELHLELDLCGREEQACLEHLN